VALSTARTAWPCRSSPSLHFQGTFLRARTPRSFHEVIPRVHTHTRATMSAAAGDSKKDEAVKVVVRVRPLSRKEIQDGHQAVAIADEERGMITVQNPKGDADDPPKSFTFDSVFGPNVTQRHIYDVCAANVVEGCLNGYNGTIFAYGQTGAGKTFTMEGAQDPPDLRGIIPNSFQHIFDKVALAEAGQQFLVRASYLEIYNEEIRDLLSKDPKNSLDLKENMDTGVYVKDLTSFVVKSAIEIDQVMQQGKKNRSVGATLMNQGSSRSHSIFTIICECSQENKSGKPSIRVGKLNLVDLAGSERQSKTGATGERLKEATKINLSLSALGNVISALVDGKSSHVPYRDSKLTRLLQDSLGGNTKTVMCANCGPAGYNYDETVSTLRYANRAKNIKNKPRINEDPKDAMLREFQEEIQRLKSQLEAANNGQPIPGLGEGGLGGGVGAGIVSERVVEKIVEVPIGEEEMKKLKEREETMKKEQEDLKQRAASEMKQLLDEQTKTAKERAMLQEKLLAEQSAREKELHKKRKLEDRLKSMQEKLIQGGEMMDLAAKQEAELRRAQIELEERKQDELRMARELAQKEEQALAIEEQYSTLQEEVDIKTKKLKKLWTKFQQAEQELKDMREEFAQDKEDLLDNLRNADRQLKLKNLVLQNFVPIEEMQRMEARAVWNDEEETWLIPRLEVAGNQVRGRRPTSATNLRRAETEYARHRKQYDPSPRYRYDNIASFELEQPERTTEDYEGPQMTSRVNPVLASNLTAEEEELLNSAVETGPSNPYNTYGGGAADDAMSTSGETRRSRKSRSKSSSGGKSRPKSAARRSDDREVRVEY